MLHGPWTEFDDPDVNGVSLALQAAARRLPLDAYPAAARPWIARMLERQLLAQGGSGLTFGTQPAAQRYALAFWIIRRSSAVMMVLLALAGFDVPPSAWFWGVLLALYLIGSPLLTAWLRLSSLTACLDELGIAGAPRNPVAAAAAKGARR